MYHETGCLPQQTRNGVTRIPGPGGPTVYFHGPQQLHINRQRSVCKVSEFLRGMLTPFDEIQRMTTTAGVLQTMGETAVYILAIEKSFKMSADIVSPSQKLKG